MQKSCSIDGCSGPVVARSWCSAHYQRWRKNGDPTLEMRPRQRCAVEGCDRWAHGYRMCHVHYMCWRNHGDPEWTRPTFEVCTVDGCEMAPRWPTAELCEMHYGRIRRNGKLTPLDRTRYKKDRGYIVIKVSDHPLAAKSGWVYEHRAVVYDLLGPGAHPCFWCREEMEWGRTLHIDHLDHVRDNNDPANLVISCRSCNTARKEGDTSGRWAELMAQRQVLAAHADEVEATRLSLLERQERRSYASRDPSIT